MKRIICLILIFSCILSLALPSASFAQSETSIDGAYAAKTLINKITDGTVSFSDSITRIEFVAALAKVFKLSETVPEKYFYDDVKSFTENSGYVYAAYGAGWISKSESFNAISQISAYEAIKIAVNALGYNLIAENNGGYPAGYILTARRIGLLSGVDSQETALGTDNAYMLIYNMLRTNLFSQLTFGTVSRFAEKDETVLSQLYDIYEISGIVSKTPYNSLNGDEKSEYENEIEINGTAYRFNDAQYDMLGVKHKVFVKKGKQTAAEVVCCFKDAEKSLSIPLRRISHKSGNTVYWYDEGGKERSTVLASSPTVIYNGRRIMAGIDECFSENSGEVTLIDNGTGGYTTVYINSYSYIQVYGADTLGNVIRDKNSYLNNIDINRALYCIYDENGAELDKFDIESGEVYQVILSKDGGFCELRRCSEKVTGTVNSQKKNYLKIDGVEYYITDYFKSFFLKDVKTGKQASFMVSPLGEIITSTDAESSILYGYAVAANLETKLETVLKLKIFSQMGEMLALEVNKSAYLDGEYKNKTAINDIYNKFTESGSFKQQLIRYGTNSAGKINMIDFYSTDKPVNPGEYADERNMLTKYDSRNFVYKIYSATFSRYFHINSACVFLIPKDTTKEEEFKIIGKSYFINDRYYTLEPYDIDETGGAKAAVYIYDSDAAVNPDNVPYLVESVDGSANENGEDGYILNLFNGTEFISKFMAKNVEVEKSATAGTVRKSVHELLSGGDIIRFDENSRNEISKIVVEFDGRKGVMQANKSNGCAVYNSDTIASPMFHDGMVYSYNGSILTISCEKQPGGGYRFNQADLKVLAGSNSLACYDVKTETARPIATADVKGWKTDGKGAHYAVIGQNNFVSKLIVLYEGMEE